MMIRAWARSGPGEWMADDHPTRVIRDGAIADILAKELRVGDLGFCQADRRGVQIITPVVKVEEREER